MRITKPKCDNCLSRVYMEYGYHGYDNHESWWCERCEGIKRVIGSYNRGKYMGLYMEMSAEISAMSDEENNSPTADKLRDRMDYIWNELEKKNGFEVISKETFLKVLGVVNENSNQ